MHADRQADLLAESLYDDVRMPHLDRADDAGAYGLGLLLPAGFIAKASDRVPDELQLAIWEQLSEPT